MTIDPLFLPVAEGVNKDDPSGNPGDINHLEDSNANSAPDHKLPAQHLAHRDTLLKTKVNEVVAAENASYEGVTFLVPTSDPTHASPKGSMEEMISQEHNADGSHKAGIFHGPVTIPGGAPLTLNTTPTQQQVGILVGSTAGKVAAGDDARFHGTDPTSATNADHDSRYIPDSTKDANGAARLGTSVSGIAASTVSAALAEIFNNLVPIGAILWWHKDMTGVPSLPSNFVECNGQVLSDGASPVNGQTMPNINNDLFGTGGGAGAFIRGRSSTNGAPDADKMQGHNHDPESPIYKSTTGATSGGATQLRVDAGVAFDAAQDAADDGVNGTPRVGLETAPVNVKMVAIIRVK